MIVHSAINYEVVIEDLVRSPIDGTVTVSGWAVDTYRKTGIRIRSKDEDVTVERQDREDIATVFNLDSSARPGFTATTLSSKGSFDLLFTINGTERPIQIDLNRLERKLSNDRKKQRLRRICHRLLHDSVSSNFKFLVNRVARKITKRQKSYDQWIRTHEVTKPADAMQIMEGFAEKPLISIVVPVYNVDEQWLRKCVKSMDAQWYSNWELCLADDHSPNESVRTLLKEISAGDPRIHAVYRDENGGIAAATNSAIELAKGQYIGFMDNDDELAPSALYEVVSAINSDPSIDFIYTDEDKITEKGIRFDPFFKPDFSPHLLLGHNYITHFVTVSRALLQKVGGLDSAFDGSQDYDFVLRATEQAQKVHHISKIMYHWRTLSSSVAGDPRSKMYAYEAGKAALEAALKRRGTDGSVRMLDNLGTYKIDYHGEVPSVAVIASGYTGEKLHDLELGTDYPRVRFVSAGKTGSDAAARECDEDLLVFLDGKNPKRADWLTEMVNYIRDDQVGVVGGKILDDRGRVANVGVTLRAMKTGQPFEMRGDWDQGIGYYFRDLLPRDMFAVTEDCLLTRRRDFERIKGFDQSLSSGLQGIDYCVRLQEECGLTTLWQPYSLFVDEAKNPAKIPQEDLDRYLASHQGMVDPFASAFFPSEKTGYVPVAGAIDQVLVSSDSSVITVTGWAADLEGHEPASVGISPCKHARLDDVKRILRPDVNMTKAMPIDSELGFKLRISLPDGLAAFRAERPSLVISGPSGQVSLTLKVPRSQAMSRFGLLLRRAAAIRHPRSFARRVFDRYLVPRRQKAAYRKLIARTEQYDKAAVKSEIDGFTYRPVISVLVPVYNVEPQWLRACVDSIRNQFYPNWELCLADDCSTDPRVAEVLKQMSAEDDRIKVVFRKENGHISRATNSALEIATGEFVALVDNDDELPPQAFFEVIKRLNEKPETDLVYSDEDKEDEQGHRFDPHFKPDYEPDLLLSTNYISHLGVYRRSIVNEIGGFRVGYEGSQDYDMLLRFMERTEPSRVQHIAKVLYHWRTLPTSTASSGGAKDYASDAGLRALSSAMERRGIDAEVVSAGPSGIYNVHYGIHDPDLVTVIIPTKNGYDNIERCMDSVIEKTKYPNYEVLIADNGSTNPAMKKLYARYKERLEDRFRVLDLDIPFNFSRINNLAAKEAKGKYLLFLNDDTQVISPLWMTRLVSFAQLQRIGVVGAKLYYPINTIQHAGLVLGLGGVAGHIMVGTPRTHFGYFGRLIENVNYYAMTAACCMVKAEDFQAVSGFDETLAVAYNDVDLCARIHDELGRDNVWAHEVELYHFESVTRGKDAKDKKKRARLEKESAEFRSRHAEAVENDPYYNPNLSRSSGNFWVRED